MAIGTCPICHRDEMDLVEDHDHATKRHRAAICRPCNMGLGVMGDNPDRLRAAARYVEHFRDNPGRPWTGTWNHTPEFRPPLTGSTMPTMSTRDFMRGGYKQVVKRNEPVMIMSHNTLRGTFYPGDTWPRWLLGEEEDAQDQEG